MKLYIVLFLLIAGACKAQTPLSYSRVIEVDSATKDELYVQAKKWLVALVNESKGEVLDFDKDEGLLSARLFFFYKTSYKSMSKETSGKVWFTINIYCKDGSYQYQFTDIKHEGTNWNEVKRTEFDWYIQDEIYYAISFGLITTNTDAPAKIADEHGRKWANGIWNEIKSKAKSIVVPLVSTLDIEMQKAGQ